jgi:hypothetical protein
MKNILLKSALGFVTLMLGIQLAFIASSTFYPKGITTLTNLITAVYNQIG